MAVLPLANHYIVSWSKTALINQRFLIMMKKSNLELSAALSSS
jgi:hypothetical protein